MWTSLTDPEDYQMLKLALVARDNFMHISLISPWADQASQVEADGNYFSIWPTYFQHGKSCQMKVAVNEDGGIDIGEQDYSGRVTNSGCSPNILRCTVERVINSLATESREGKKWLTEDTPFWPVCGTAQGWRFYSIKHPSELLRELNEHISQRSWQYKCVWWRVEHDWVNSHPFTLKKLRDLLKRLPKGRKSSPSAISGDQFVTERRKVLLRNLAGIKGMIAAGAPTTNSHKTDPYYAQFKNYECNVASIVHTALSSLMYKYPDHVYRRICSQAVDDALIPKPGVCSTDWPELAEHIKNIFKSNEWKEVEESVKMIIADEGMPDVRYYLFNLGFITY